MRMRMNAYNEAECIHATNSPTALTAATAELTSFNIFDRNF